MLIAITRKTDRRHGTKKRVPSFQPYARWHGATIENKCKLKDVLAKTDEDKEVTTPPKRKKTKPNLQPLWETEARAGPKMEARAHLLEAAAGAFMERGFAATTLDHVALLLGTTKGQIYHYYRSKNDLYFDVVVGAFFMVNDTTGPAAEQSGVRATTRLFDVAKAHAITIMRNFSFQRVALEATQHQLIAQLSARQDRAMRRILHFRDQYENLLSNLIAEGVRTGEFEVASVPLATKAVLGSLNWLTVWFDPKKSKIHQSENEIATGLANFVIAGLMPSSAGFKTNSPGRSTP